MLRFLTAGESHGPALMAVLEGVPSGLALSEEAISHELRRRQQGVGSSTRMRLEQDAAQILSGVINGRTTGAPIGLFIENKDVQAVSGRPVTVPRPGHGDLTASLKYGYDDVRLAAERASARETAARVAVGVVCKHLLAELGIAVGGYVAQIGSIVASLAATADSLPFVARFARAETSPVRCPDEEASQDMVEAIRQAQKQGDTLGGVFEIVALNVPPGLGSHVHWDRRLDTRLAAAMASIPAVKGFECGPAFRNVGQRGSQVHDTIWVAGGLARRDTNRAGGLEAGISNGQPIHLRAAMKPLPTVHPPLPSIDLVTGQPATAPQVRSDCCAVPRAMVVGEAMVAYILAGAVLETLGGDTMDQVRCRWRTFGRRWEELSTGTSYGDHLILTGFMGTGKTAVGQIVAERLGRPFVDMDATIEEAFGLSIDQIFAAHGEPTFRRAEEALCRDLTSRRGLVIATGGGTLVPPENRQRMMGSGLVVCFIAHPDAIVERLGAATDRPLLEDQDPQAIRERVQDLLAQRWDAYTAIPHQIDTSALSPAEVAEQVLAIWKAAKP